MGGVSAKSEMLSRLPMAMPMTMLTRHEHRQQPEVLESQEE